MKSNKDRGRKQAWSVWTQCHGVLSVQHSEQRPKAYPSRLKNASVAAGLSGVCSVSKQRWALKGLAQKRWASTAKTCRIPIDNKNIHECLSNRETVRLWHGERISCSECCGHTWLWFWYVWRIELLTLDTRPHDVKRNTLPNPPRKKWYFAIFREKENEDKQRSPCYNGIPVFLESELGIIHRVLFFILSIPSCDPTQTQ